MILRDIRWTTIILNENLLEQIMATREKEFMLLNSTGLEAPNFNNAIALQEWIDWDGDFDSMQKERVI